MNENADLDDEAREGRARVQAAKIHNDRMKFVASICQASVIGLIGLGVLRFALDPEAPSISAVQIVLTIAIGIGLASAAWVVLGLQRPEE